MLHRLVRSRIWQHSRDMHPMVEAPAKRLSELGDEAVRRAEGLARAGARTTILECDLAEAFETVLPSGDAGRPTQPWSSPSWTG